MMTGGTVAGLVAIAIICLGFGLFDLYKGHALRFALALNLRIFVVAAAIYLIIFLADLP